MKKSRYLFPYRLQFQSLCDNDIEVTELGINKFNEQIKSKIPSYNCYRISPRLDGWTAK